MVNGWLLGHSFSCRFARLLAEYSSTQQKLKQRISTLETRDSQVGCSSGCEDFDVAINTMFLSPTTQVMFRTYMGKYLSAEKFPIFCFMREQIIEAAKGFIFIMVNGGMPKKA